jgi:hypothetical protein
VLHLSEPLSLASATDMGADKLDIIPLWVFKIMIKIKEKKKICKISIITVKGI